MNNNAQKNERFVASVELGDLFEAMQWVPDADLIAERYPNNNLYAKLLKHEKSYEELYEKIEDELCQVHDYRTCQRELYSLARTCTFATIFLQGGGKQRVTNRDIVAWIGPHIESCKSCVFGHYVVFMIQNALGQAGGIGIWDCVSNDWRFTIYDEGLCVEEIGYNPTDDSFSGQYEWQLPMVGAGGTGTFRISSDNRFAVLNEIRR